jgi:hypothetical protein
MAVLSYRHSVALDAAHNRVLTAMRELFEAIRRAEAAYTWIARDYERHVAEAARTRSHLRAAGYLQG